MTGGNTVPVLVLDGEAIGDSTRIIAALERHRPEPALYPSAESDRGRTLGLEEFFDEEFGHFVRLTTLALERGDTRTELRRAWEIANRDRTESYCVIPFLLPPPKIPCPARAEKASQAGRRRFDPGRPLSWKPSATPRVSLPWVVARHRP